MKTHVAVSAIALLIGFVVTDKIDSDIPCVETVNCTNIPTLPPGAICQKGYCMCLNDKDFVKCSAIQASIRETKTSGPLLYRRCKHDQDCKYSGGFCNTTNQQCECSKDYVPSSDKHHCIQKARSINSSCTENNQCLAFLSNTTCHSNKCVCAPGYHYTDNACWRMTGYKQPCTKSQECSHIEGANCTDNRTCECEAEMVLSEDGKKCLPAVKHIQDECTESVQCMTFQHSLCVEKMCRCQENFHFEHNMTKCFPNKEIGAACVTSYECYQAENYKSYPPIKTLICKNNVCTCAENYVNVENICVNGGPLMLASFSIIALTALIYVVLL